MATIYQFRSWRRSPATVGYGDEGVDRPRYLPADGQDGRTTSGAVVGAARVQLEAIGDTTWMGFDFGRKSRSRTPTTNSQPMCTNRGHAGTQRGVQSRLLSIPWLFCTVLLR